MIPVGAIAPRAIIARAAPLDTEYNIAVRVIAARLFPTGYDLTDDFDAAPQNLEELNALLDGGKGRMVVWTGASDTTIFADPDTNWAFRAWHDWCHWKGQFPFTLDGERDAVAMQCEHLETVYGKNSRSARFKRLATCDILGTFTYREAVGDYPENQRAVTEALLSTMPVLH